MTDATWIAFQTPKRLTWQSKAACVEVDPALFFPERGGGGSRMAKAICERCSVRARCLDWALEFEEFGVFGGTTPEERKQLRRQRGIPSPARRAV